MQSIVDGFHIAPPLRPGFLFGAFFDRIGGSFLIYWRNPDKFRLSIDEDRGSLKGKNRTDNRKIE